MSQPEIFCAESRDSEDQPLHLVTQEQPNRVELPNELTPAQHFLQSLIGRVASEMSGVECDDAIDVIIPHLYTIPPKAISATQRNRAMTELLAATGKLGGEQSISTIASRHKITEGDVVENIQKLGRLVGRFLPPGMLTDLVSRRPGSPRPATFNMRLEASSIQAVGRYEESFSDAAALDITRVYLNVIKRHDLLGGGSDERAIHARILAGDKARLKLQDPTLSGEEKAHLTRVAEEGDAEKQRFLEANLRLVSSIAKRYVSSGMPLLDLVQEGNIGLMHALEKFDSSKGFKFSTYATTSIRHAISRGIKNTGRTIRLPVHIGDGINAMLKQRHFMIESNQGIEPTDEALAEALNITVDMLNVYRDAIRLQPISTDETAVHDMSKRAKKDYYADQKSDEGFRQVELDIEIAALQEAIQALPFQQQRYLNARYGLNGRDAQMVKDIISDLGISESRVKPMQNEIKATLRRLLIHTGKIEP